MLNGPLQRFLRGVTALRANPETPPWLWHLTERPDFTIDPTYRPHWAYGARPANSKPALFLTNDPRYWRPYFGPSALWAVRVAPSADVEYLGTKTLHPEWLDESPAEARVLEVLPLGEAIARYPDAFGNALEWLLAEEVTWDDRRDREVSRTVLRPGLALPPGTRLADVLRHLGVGRDEDPAGALDLAATDALAPLLPEEDRGRVDDFLAHPFSCKEAEVYTVSDASDLTHRLGVTGYHWTSQAALDAALREGLGADPAEGEDHELPALYCALDLDGARAVRRAAAGGQSADEAVRAALRRHMPTHRIAWLAGDADASRHFGDALVRVDLKALGDWISDEKRDALMYPDRAFGWGLLLDGPIPARFLSAPARRKPRRKTRSAPP